MRGIIMRVNDFFDTFLSVGGTILAILLLVVTAAVVVAVWQENEEVRIVRETCAAMQQACPRDWRQ
jgi:hypothetical protein